MIFIWIRITFLLGACYLFLGHEEAAFIQLFIIDFIGVAAGAANELRGELFLDWGWLLLHSNLLFASKHSNLMTFLLLPWWLFHIVSIIFNLKW